MIGLVACRPGRLRAAASNFVGLQISFVVLRCADERAQSLFKFRVSSSPAPETFLRYFSAALTDHAGFSPVPGVVSFRFHALPLFGSAASRAASVSAATATFAAARNSGVPGTSHCASGRCHRGGGYAVAAAMCQRGATGFMSASGRRGRSDRSNGCRWCGGGYKSNRGCSGRCDHWC